MRTLKDEEFGKFADQCIEYNTESEQNLYVERLHKDTDLDLDFVRDVLHHYDAKDYDDMEYVPRLYEHLSYMTVDVDTETMIHETRYDPSITKRYASAMRTKDFTFTVTFHRVM